MHACTFVLKAVWALNMLSKISICPRACDGPSLTTPFSPYLPSHRIDVLGSGQPASQRRYRNWNPPLLGNLPDDFLRILPQQMDSIQVRGYPQTSTPTCLSSISSGLCHGLYQPVLLLGFQAQAGPLLWIRICKERKVNPQPRFGSGLVLWLQPSPQAGGREMG